MRDTFDIQSLKDMEIVRHKIDKGGRIPKEHGDLITVEWEG
jgi:hypothetical protein